MFIRCPSPPPQKWGAKGDSHLATPSRMREWRNWQTQPVWGRLAMIALGVRVPSRASPCILANPGTYWLPISEPFSFGTFNR